MKITRRSFCRFGATGAAFAGIAGIHPPGAYAHRPKVKFKVGVTDWELHLEMKPEALALAKKLGFDGLQVSLGRGPKNRPVEKLPLGDLGLQQTYLEVSRKVKLPIASVCLDILHVNGLKSDPLGQRWVAEAIPVAKALGAKVILLPLVGKGALKTPAEMDRVGDILREVAPAAEKAGVVLGLEDTISAKDNVRIMERSKSKAVLTYYDIGNSTKNGFGVIEEIRWLGAARICEVHLKDLPHVLGEGNIDVRGVIDALADIGFSEWAQIESECPAESVEACMGSNLKYVRRVIAARS